MVVLFLEESRMDSKAVYESLIKACFQQFSDLKTLNLSKNCVSNELSCLKALRKAYRLQMYHDLRQSRLLDRHTVMDIRHVVFELMAINDKLLNQEGHPIELLFDEQVPDLIMGNQYYLELFFTVLFEYLTLFTENDSKLKIQFISRKNHHLMVLKHSGNVLKSEATKTTAAYVYKELIRFLLLMLNGKGHDTGDIELPVNRLTAQEEAVYKKHHRHDVREAVEGKSILVAEHDVITKMHLCQVLKCYGVKVRCVSNGQEAVSVLLQNSHFDLIFMNTRLPIKDGISAVNDIRNIYNENELPIIGLINEFSMKDAYDSSKAGMNEIIYKPLGQKLLLDKVRAYCCAVVRKEEYRQDTIEQITLYGISVEKGLLYHNNNEKLYKKMLVKFSDKYINFEKTYHQMLDDGDHDSIVRAFHTLKGLTLGLGALELSDLMKSMELAYRDNQDGPVDSKEVFRELKKVIDAINQLTFEPDDLQYPDEMIQMLKELKHVTEFNMLSYAKTIIDKMSEKDWGISNNDKVHHISSHIKAFNFKKALMAIDSILVQSSQ